MTIEIQDNREAWLIRLGKDYAVAVSEESVAQKKYEAARLERIRIGNEIARIGGYVVEAAKEGAEPCGQMQVAEALEDAEG